VTCINYTTPGRWQMVPCDHEREDHDEDGECSLCDCTRYADDISDHEGETFEGWNKDASYRSEMREAGRGALLR
jgi:hypothetical protein